jgi:hypothetical protein
MTDTRVSTIRRLGINALLLGFVLMLSPGCQTFSLSDEDFHRQQNGQVADPQTGEAVAVAGTAAYFGATIGAAIAAALGK